MNTPIESALPGTVPAGRFDSQSSPPAFLVNGSSVAMTIPAPDLDQVDTDMDGVVWLRGSRQ
jgi:hypothetical protein